jgi:hypothetical protein
MDFYSGRNKRKQTEIEPCCFKWTPPPHIHLTESLLSLKNKEKSVPEIIDPVFAETSQNARRFELVFVKTGSINSGTGDMRGGV